MTQTTLTAPLDKTGKAPISNDPPLSIEEFEEAKNELIRPVYNKQVLYKKIERQFVDPTYQNQMYCLHSFIPSNEAKPDKNGFFGMFKFRGAFQTIEEADARAEWLIKNHDSCHIIYTGRIGFPLPACVDGLKNVSADINNVGGINEFMKKDKKKNDESEKAIREELKKRELDLIEDATNPNIDPFELYIELHNKKSIIIDTFINYKDRLLKMKQNVYNTIERIKVLDIEHPTFKNEYKEKLFKSREDVGLSNDEKDISFLKYIDLYEPDDILTLN